jgi:hypothetical protein
MAARKYYKCIEPKIVLKPFVDETVDKELVTRFTKLKKSE